MEGKRLEQKMPTGQTHTTFLLYIFSVVESWPNAKHQWMVEQIILQTANWILHDSYLPTYMVCLIWSWIDINVIDHGCCASCIQL